MIEEHELHELFGKYSEMLRLRREDAEGSGGDPRRALLRLAHRFPGALRELDEHPMEVLESRHAALDRARSGAVVQPWMVASARFHRLMRGALAAKRWLRGRRDVDEAVIASFRETLPSLSCPADAALWGDDLRALVSPPRGRMSEVVLGRVGRSMGLSSAEAKAHIFGPPRRRGG